MADVVLGQETLILRDHLGLSPAFGGVRVAHLFSFDCCVFYFVCLRPVSLQHDITKTNVVSSGIKHIIFHSKL